MLENPKQPAVRIEQNTLIINNIIIPYSKQIIRSSQTLFITDLGIEVPITQELRTYDETYFQRQLKKQIVYELESNHVSVGLEILQQLSTLQAEHYEYILSKISLKKLAKMLMDDEFLTFLVHSFRRITKIPAMVDQDHDKLAIINLHQAYQRAIYLLTNIQESSSNLKRQLEFSCKEFLQDIVLQPNFIQKIAFPSQIQYEYQEKEKTGEVKPENHFLHMLYELAIHLRVLQKNTSIQWQIDQYYIDKVQRNKDQVLEMTNVLQGCINGLLNKLVFNKACLNFIGKHFHDLFQNCRKDLLKILVFIITHNREQFWKKIINQTNKTNQKGEEISDNSDSLRELILNSYFSKDSFTWDLSLFLLQNLNSMPEAETILVNIYLDFVQSRLTREIIELIWGFIKNVAQPNRQLPPQLKILVPAFMESIIQQIDTIWSTYSKQKYGKQPQFPFLNMCLPIPKFPRVKTSYLCALLKAFSTIISCDLLDCLNGLNYEKAIQCLVLLTKGRDNIMHGAMIQFIRLIQEKVKEKTSTCPDKKDRKTNVQKQPLKHSSSLQRLKRILQKAKQL